jgi:ribonuclease HII
MSIAAASILAKTHRDEFMKALHLEYPEYGWNKNMGYPTAFHRKAIAKFGLTPWNRLTFNVSEQLKLDLKYD